MADPVHLKTALCSYPHTVALKDHSLTSPDVVLDFTEVEPIHKAFAPMVRRQDFDLSELAIVTALQALAFGSPIVVLPAVVASRLQRGCLIQLAARDPIAPRDLVGKRVGVRAYTQTTGMWVRAALREDYDIAPEAITCVTRDAGHVADYADPDFVVHEEAGKSLLDQMRDGEIEAAILGNDLPKGDEFKPVIVDHRAVDVAWRDRHGFMPINHVVAVSRVIAETQPAAVRAAYRLLREGARTAPPRGAEDPTRFGIEAVRGPLAFIIDECQRQALLPRALDVDEVLAASRALLGDEGT